MLKKNINAIKLKYGKKKKLKVFGKQSLNNFSINVPGDPSSAAFFTALTFAQKQLKP